MYTFRRGLFQSSSLLYYIYCHFAVVDYLTTVKVYSLDQLIAAPCLLNKEPQEPLRTSAGVSRCKAIHNLRPRSLGAFESVANHVYAFCVFKQRPISPSLHTIFSVSTISIMKLLNLFSREVDFVTESHAPLDTDGAPPSRGSFEKEVSEMLGLWVNPAIKLSDIVSVD